MKKILAIFTIGILAAGAADAQTKKGNWLVGGSAGFNSSKVSTSSNSTTTINISPDAGYFVANNLAVGANVGFWSSSYNSSTTTVFNFGPMARYYFAEMGKNAKLFGHAFVGFGSSKQGSNPSVSSTTWGINAGPAFFLNKNVALEATVGYNSEKVKNATYTTGTFGVNFGFQIHL